MTIACCALSAGCALMATTADSRATNVGVAPYIEEGARTPFDQDPSDDPTVVLQMMFEVERVLIPSDTPADDREILWKYVDELRVD
ncbi:MAG: hypothetical protein IIB61_09020, partial [Planctomycetes bacterium]|nr:hypothetical protein [Planctomycetota bacterium]